jgi:hypothetical protein
VRVPALTRALGLAGTGAVALTLVAACGGGSNNASTTGADPATVRTATCTSWKTASSTEKDALVIGMRDFFGGQVDSPGLRGQVLPDGKARQLFDSYCARRFAGAFSLYRLYGNAAAFNPSK